jgi:hypothetical protein
MTELTNLRLLPQPEVIQRTESGLISPIGIEDSWNVVECGDVRKHTEPSRQQSIRIHGGEVLPGRYFGATSGLAVTALMSIAAQLGEGQLKNFIAEYSQDALVNFAVDLSERANQVGTELTQHTANGNEGNDFDLAPEHNHGPVGCKFNALGGFVLYKSISESTFSEASRISSITGVELPLQEALAGGQILSQYLQPDFAVTRSSLKKADVSPTNPARRLTVLDGPGYGNEETAVVIDMGRYKASAAAHIQAGIPRYHHTPEIAADMLSNLMPEFRLERPLVTAAALLIGSGTRHALSGEKTPYDLPVEIIPPEYSAA